MSLTSKIKRAAMDAIEEGKPVAITYGTVISVTPLEINVEQRMNIKGNMILLTSNVIDKEVEVEVNDITEEKEGHKHEYKGTKKHIHKKGLKVGEKVLLLRVQGGQKYIVLDRLVSV